MQAVNGNGDEGSVCQRHGQSLRAFHPYVGEEAVANGSWQRLMTMTTSPVPTAGTPLIAKGGDLNRMAAEIFFKETGYNKVMAAPCILRICPRE